MSFNLVVFVMVVLQLPLHFLQLSRVTFFPGAVRYDHPAEEDSPEFSRSRQRPATKTLSRSHQDIQAHQWGEPAQAFSYLHSQ